MKSEALEFNLEEEVAKVVNAKKTNSNSMVDPRTPKAKIQKVPAFLRERCNFSKYYSPKLLSIGPIHHHNDIVKAGEQYKRLWMATYLSARQQEGRRSTCGQQCALEKFIIDKYTKIKDKIAKVIERCYTEEVIEEYKCNNYEALAWMLFVDGCSVLEFMNKASYEKPDALKIKIDQLILMQQDLLLLENQIPFELLKLLCKEVAVQDTIELSKSLCNFLKLNHMVPKSVIEPQSVPICQQPICQKSTCQQPTHLLDYLRKILCDELTDTQSMILCDNQTDNQHKETSSVEQTTINIMSVDETDIQRNNTSCLDQIATKICPKKKQKNNWPRNRNIQELKAAGIKVTRQKKYLKATNKCNITEIHFSSHLFRQGEMFLQPFVVDDSTGTTFSNLIAYEMCPDFKNKFTISSYVAFLDSLIDHPEDVKELRKNGIVYNNLGSDQEVADLFNTITTDLVPDPRMYDEVKMKMEKHCKTRLKTWMAEFTFTHFQSPWSVLALLAAILVLGLTIVQTYYTIPRSQPEPEPHPHPK